MKESIITRFNLLTVCGSLFLVGGVQWFLGILAAESW
jgi:hypothetical protein